MEIGRKAAPHQRRVTLNLIRHSSGCRQDLRLAIDRLAAVDWKLDAIEPVDAELIYAFVDEEVADRARDEFVADLDTIRDLYREPRIENPENLCELCGHQHIRWEFDLINTKGGKSTKTGSVCIEEYGLNVDGYGTAEAALAALTAAVRAAQHRADMADWRDAHPDHETVIAQIEDRAGWLARMSRNPRAPDGTPVGRWLLPLWQERTKELLTIARRVCAYYAKHHGLTDTSTRAVYGRDLRGRLDACYAEWEAACETYRTGGAK